MSELTTYIRAAYAQEFEPDEQSPVEDLVRHAFVTLAERSKALRAEKARADKAEAEAAKCNDLCAEIGGDDPSECLEIVRGDNMAHEGVVKELDKATAELSACRADLTGDPRTMCDRVADSMRSRERALEVERDQLRAEVDRLRASLGDGPDAQAKEITRLRAEVERLKVESRCNAVQVKIVQGVRDAEKARADKAGAELVEVWDALGVLKQLYGGCAKAIAAIIRRAYKAEAELATALDGRRVENIRADDAVAARAKAERERDEARADAAVERERREADSKVYMKNAQWTIETEKRLEQAVALLTYVNNAIRLADWPDLEDRLRSFLAGQPAPAKPVVDDAMVERAASVLLARPLSRQLLRAALVAALEGRG